MRRALLVVGLVLAVCGGWAARGLASAIGTSGNVRGVVSLIGDSNITAGSTEIARVWTARNDGYAVVDLSRPGARIRTPDCPMFTYVPCPTYNFWAARLADARQKINTDAFVVNLGINDALSPGTSVDGPGYARYDKKIDWLMPLFGGRPVIWTTLPCTLEPSSIRVGCRAVNAALLGARPRWHNLTVVDWGTVANVHPEYIVPHDVHYTEAGNDAWAALVMASLDSRFPD